MKTRTKLQLVGTLLGNLYLPGFWQGSIYQGALKAGCTPLLNCWSCPGALFSCPIGVLQYFAITGNISFLALGFLFLIGSFVGRATCGWLCPFGFVQDLLYQIPTPKLNSSNQYLWIKYLVLITLVFIVPYITAVPWFSKLCPVGALEAAVPLVLVNKEVRQNAGMFFYLKIAILVLVLIFCVIKSRAFCLFLCPLGAIYSIFNKVSIFKLKVDNSNCKKCNSCFEHCPMGIYVYKTPNHINCIRCLECLKACPVKVIKFKGGIQ